MCLVYLNISGLLLTAIPEAFLKHLESGTKAIFLCAACAKALKKRGIIADSHLSHLQRRRFISSDTLSAIERICEAYPPQTGRGSATQDTDTPSDMQWPKRHPIKDVDKFLRRSEDLSALLMELPLDNLKSGIERLCKEYEQLGCSWPQHKEICEDAVGEKPSCPEEEETLKTELVKLWIENPSAHYSVVQIFGNVASSASSSDYCSSSIPKKSDALIASVCGCTKTLDLPSGRGSTPPFLPRYFVFYKGQIGSGKTMHTEWGDAANLAVIFNTKQEANAGCRDVKLHEKGMQHGEHHVTASEPPVVAEWWLISPLKAQETLNWVKSHLAKDPDLKHLLSELGIFSSSIAARAVATEIFQKHWCDLCKHLGSAGEERPFAVRLDQRSGEVVHVPPGWLHWVETKEECLKLAWQFSIPTHITQYVRSAFQWASDWQTPFTHGGAIPLNIDKTLCEAARCWASGGLSFWHDKREVP
jgi:hypothetical protein